MQVALQEAATDPREGSDAADDSGCARRQFSPLPAANFNDANIGEFLPGARLTLTILFAVQTALYRICCSICCLRSRSLCECRKRAGKDRSYCIIACNNMMACSLHLLAVFFCFLLLFTVFICLYVFSCYH